MHACQDRRHLAKPFQMVVPLTASSCCAVQVWLLWVFQHGQMQQAAGQVPSLGGGGGTCGTGFCLVFLSCAQDDCTMRQPPVLCLSSATFQALFSSGIACSCAGRVTYLPVSLSPAFKQRFWSLPQLEIILGQIWLALLTTD